MKKILIYATSNQGSQEIAAINEAIEESKKGNKVLFIHCDRTIGCCIMDNPQMNPLICKRCEYYQRSRAKHFLPKEVQYVSIKDLVTNEIKDRVNIFDKSYNSVDDLRKLKYRGVRIGYGALSSYISVTRNMEPSFSVSFKNYLNKIIDGEVLLTEVVHSVITSYKPDLIISHNGRFAQYRPVIELAEQMCIDYIVTEFALLSNGDVQKDYFYNAIAHNAKVCGEKYTKVWDEADEIDRIKTGEAFFKNRRNAVYAGDTVYIKDQIKGKMPVNWDETKHNIVIFNSSEDEFCAINEEVDNAAVFSNQLEGIKAIVNRYKDRKDWNITLRIHPHLKGIPFRYHSDLYKIEADNFYVISADSSISSYSLMDNADLIIVFGSTMGVESSYWGKKVICLAYSFYRELDVVYHPKSKEELWNLMETDNLEPKSKKGALIYGFYYMTTSHDAFENFDVYFKHHSLFGFKYNTSSYLRTIGSSYLYGFCNKLYRILTRFACLFKDIPL